MIFESATSISSSCLVHKCRVVWVWAIVIKNDDLRSTIVPTQYQVCYHSGACACCSRYIHDFFQLRRYFLLYYIFLTSISTDWTVLNFKKMSNTSSLLNLQQGSYEFGWWTRSFVKHWGIYYNPWFEVASSK